MKKEEHQEQQLSFGKSLALLLTAIIVIVFCKKFMSADTSVSLCLAAVFASVLAMLWGVPWDEIENQIKENFKSMTVPVMILMCVGMLVGSWILSGTIPTMIYYGMLFIRPSIFLIMACIIAALMSIMTGTSWGTVSTVGVALMGVSMGLGIPLAYTAGAITTGAIFGDKLSPLSDTTVMSAAVAGADLIEHIKYMLYNTVPCLIISLVLYAFLGMKYRTGTIDGEDYWLLLETLSATFKINPIVMIPPVVVLVLIVMKKPTVPTFFSGILAAMVLSLVFQSASFEEVLGSLGAGYTIPTGVDVVDSMVLRGGLSSMLGTVVLVLSAGIFGAPLKASGAIEAIIAKIEGAVKNEKQMMLTVGLLHMILFLVVVSYYISFIIIGNMTKDLFDKYGLARKNLSRTLEDTGTAIAPLIPWGLSGAFYSSTLGVSSAEFGLFAPICYLSFIIGAFYILTGFTIARADKPFGKAGEIA